MKSIFHRWDLEDQYYKSTDCEWDFFKSKESEKAYKIIVILKNPQYINTKPWEVLSSRMPPFWTTSIYESNNSPDVKFLDVILPLYQ